MKRFFALFVVGISFIVYTAPPSFANSVRLGNLYQAKQFPIPPENCFDENPYCYETEIVYEGSTRYIQVTIYGQFDDSEFSSPEELVNRYFDFDRWPEYMQGRDSVRFVISKKLPTTTDSNNKPVYRHFSHYYTEAPFPIWNLEVKEVSEYRYLVPNPQADSDLAIGFDLVRGRHSFPEYGVSFNDCVGIKNKMGKMFVKHDKENHRYLILSVTRVTPGIDILPSVAAPYVEKSTLTIFQGIFNL